jgi:aspartate carbamoyltransferase catalytic subunit
MTRIQGERFPDQADYEKVKHAFTLTPQMLVGSKKNLSVLHPLPRVTEIDPAVDAMPQAQYFDQAENGVYVREAVLALVLGKR